MISLPALVCATLAHSVWLEIEDPFTDFLGGDDNEASDYLIDGFHWYQLKVQLHGIYYFIPLSVMSENKNMSLTHKNVSRYKWIFALPVYPIKSEWNTIRRSNHELNAKYGQPASIHGVIRRSCMSITAEKNGKYIANIDWVYANKYYSGSEIMTIFMVILVKKGINFDTIKLTDTATKSCDKSASIPYGVKSACMFCIFRHFIESIDHPTATLLMPALIFSM